MKPSELRLKSRGELEALLNEVREKIRTLRFNLAQGKVKNIHTLQETKRDNARILTILREDELKSKI